MQIEIAQNAGFCFGVRRATDCVEQYLSRRPRPILYTLGHLIHNRLYNLSLEGQGVRAIGIEDAQRIASESDRLGETVLIVRAHGIPKQDSELLRQLCAAHPAFFVVDMTCPKVKSIHEIVSANTRPGDLLLLLGNPEHPEVAGIVSYSACETRIFQTAEQVLRWHQEGVFDKKRLIVASQTTQNLFEFKKTEEIIKKLYTNAIFFDTICSVTEKRQTEAVRMAQQSDCMLVIGSRDSSNTQKLYQLCSRFCPHTHLIESARDLAGLSFSGYNRLSITAGASTPGGVIMEVYETMSNTQQVENFEEMLEESLKTLHTGETVTGVVSGVTDTGIYLDLGVKQSGFIATENLTDDPNAKLSDMFKVGDEVKAFVIRVNDGEGVITLSKKRVDAEQSWAALEALYQSGEVVETQIKAAVKGGLVCSIGGNRVFIPASQSGVPKDGDLSALVGTTQRVRLIELDADRKRALASIRVVKNEERKAAEAALWEKLEVGMKFTGKVKNLTSYGAFVDLGGVDGMIHNSELSWKRIKHPSQVVSVGQEVDVYIKELDPEKKRISLGYKTEEMDDFAKFAKEHKVGDVVTGKIVSIMPFGAFAEVAPGVDGLIHISRMSLEKIAKPEDAVSMGQEVQVKITEIDTEGRKLALSIRALLEEAQRAERDAQRAAERAERDAQRKEEEERLAQERAEMAPYIVGSI